MTQKTTPAAPRTATELLRSMWERRLDALSVGARPDDLRLRVHRALSWFERAEQLRMQDGVHSEDDQLVFTWTALNSLYGYWLPDKNEPAPDVQSLESFLDILFELDHEGQLADFIENRRDLIAEVFDNQFLAKQFWNAPTIEAAERRTSLGRAGRARWAGMLAARAPMTRKTAPRGVPRRST